MPASIYLDHNATTPVATEVVEAMATALRNSFGNPSSSYSLGREAAEQIATARDAVASLIGAPAERLVFTGCATEANNLALLGVARACPLANAIWSSAPSNIPPSWPRLATWKPRGGG
ncbi:aminotransferase class V-fold PLP-dependent enzyme [Halomonas sp. C05BenzN]|uniref:aminotransferase class V-fold PLP-dependent enzyme n=1 Tax=Halomonas sp. C05BenzN TaxID=3411041 RepID=UPI003B93BEA9